MTAIYRAEDEPSLIQEFFSRDPGVVVEVGANDPHNLSQSLAFERRGWRSVLVEPHPVYAQKLRASRNGKIYECACGRYEDAGTTVTLFMSGGESSVSLDLMQPHGIQKVEGSVRVPVRPLDDILKDAQVDRIDLLSIDVEGYELNVLQGFDLNKYAPTLVLLEDHLYDLAKHRHMLRQGYCLARRTGSNSWYVPEMIFRSFSLSLSDHFFLWRKYYFGTPWRNVRHRYGMWKAMRSRVK